MTGLTVEEEVSALLRREILFLEGVSDEHARADCPPRVQDRVVAVIDSLRALTYEYEERHGVTF